MHAAIAAKKLVASRRFNDAQGGIGPGKWVVWVGNRRLRNMSGLETLRRRGDNHGLSHRGLADLGKGRPEEELAENGQAGKKREVRANNHENIPEVWCPVEVKPTL